MKISYNWLKDYVAVDLPAEELADQLTMAGLEVDGVDRIGSEFEGIVVGRVASVDKHPDADRLVICSVDLGLDDPVQIVCGAPNVATGQNVPVATVGTTLHLPSRDTGELQPIKIKKSKIRGAASHGMICAEDELGLSDNHDGIMVLSEDASPGEAFIDYLKRKGLDRSDVVYDIGLTPNRPDAICHTGVARDIAAVNKLDLQIPEVGKYVVGDSADGLTVTIDDAKACTRYVGITVRGVTVGESPSWLKERLENIGLRPRNNIVDITNYVMHELGQPLHAFDLDLLKGNRIVVRSHDKEINFTTLDGKERTLAAGTPMIADGQRDVAIAGVMGGENSEVSDETTNILIESAYFDPPTIRRVSKALGLQTDASYRFERGVDREGQLRAAARAADLIAELAGGQPAETAVDERIGQPEERTLKVRHDRVNLIAGVNIPASASKEILTALGFTVRANENALECDVPSYRHDIEREIDVIEEVVRIFGYDAIDEPDHTLLPHYIPRVRIEDDARLRISRVLVGAGFSEIYTNSLLNPEVARAANSPELLGERYAGDVVVTANAISSEMSAMRPSLLPGALSVVSHNINHGQDEVRVFEFGHVFRKGDLPENVIDGYIEQEALCVVSAGESAGDWRTGTKAADVFDLKGVVATILDKTVTGDVSETTFYDRSAVSSYRIEYRHGEHLAATVGRVATALTERSDIEIPVYFAEMNWSLLLQIAAQADDQQYHAVNRFPVVSRDIAVIVSADVEAGKLVDLVHESGKPLLQSTRVFDVYEGKGIETGKKSLAINMRFGADRTLKDKEVDRTVSRIVDRLSTEHGAILRQ